MSEFVVVDDNAVRDRRWLLWMRKVVKRCEGHSTSTLTLTQLSSDSFATLYMRQGSITTELKFVVETIVKICCLSK